MSFPIGLILDLVSAAQGMAESHRQQTEFNQAMSDVNAQGQELQVEIRKAKQLREQLKEQAKQQVAEAQEQARQQVASTTIQTERGMRNIWEELQKCKQRAQTKDDEIKRLKLQVAAFGQRVQAFPAGAWY